MITGYVYKINVGRWTFSVCCLTAILNRNDDTLPWLNKFEKYIRKLLSGYEQYQNCQ